MFTVHNEVGKVMFLQVCVCPQGGGGIPGLPCSMSPGGGGVCLLQGVPGPGVGWRVPGPGGVPGQGGGDPSPHQQMATVADGTHPTGMHSCFTGSLSVRGWGGRGGGKSSMYLGIDHMVGYSADIRPRDLPAWEGHLVVATETETYSFQVGSMHPT